jgi:hypothetical protein
VLGSEPAPVPSDIVSSFVFLGDSQLGKEEAAPGDTSFANVTQLRQTLKDISMLERKPAYIFFCGDLVDNSADDHGEILALRLEAFTRFYRQTSREFGLDIPLVPAPGNHEIMKLISQDNKLAEAINPYTYPVWVKWLERDGFGRFSGNGPTATGPNPDLLAGDNRRLTYSFDDPAGNHFILINTFTLNNEPAPLRGWVPYHWIAEDARRAEANPRVRHIFAFGHMPIRVGGFPFDSKGANGILSNDSHPLAQQLQETFGGLSKFSGYLCGHLHLWDCSQLPGSNAIWQVISGLGGSRLIQHSAGAWQPPFFFGFTLVQIHRNGQVGVVSYRRPVPEPYYSTAAQSPARPQPEILLLHGSRKSASEALNGP